MAKVTLSGLPADPNYAGPAPRPADPHTGLYGDYWILPEEERQPSRPVRHAYRHTRCGMLTKIATMAIAETIAANPSFYSHMFCATCRNHYPIGARGEFVWRDTDEKVGT